MKVKIFDESHESDLEASVNAFLSEHKDIVDIKYQVSIAMFSEEQIYCFSAMIIYK
ncbi:MAG: sporulation protein Cse60 [Bacilli bacterium]|nr:sporulation protein Cse60 [Bacilli bacterium]